MEGQERTSSAEISKIEALKKKYGSRISVLPQYKVLEVLQMENGCCPDLPVLLTANYIRHENRWNYSCQCGCGGWCTTGMPTAEGAIDHYRRMSAGESLYGGFLNFVI